MKSGKARVGLVRGDDRRRNVRHALDLVREDVAPRVREQVLLKPNFLSADVQLASTHPDAMRGTIDFLLELPDPPREIIVAEGANERFTGQAFENFGYPRLTKEFPVPVRLLDLHNEEDWVETGILLADRSEATVRMSRTVLDCPCTISVAVAKTHDVCVVTLALKNMIMGSLHKDDRIRMHGYASHADRVLPREAQTMGINLARVARHLAPDIAVVDGTTALQGNGPGGTDGVELGMAVASADVLAADAVAASVMGFDPKELGALHYADKLGFGTADPERIEVLGARIEDVRHPVVPHESTARQLQWREAGAEEKYLGLAHRGA